MKALIRLNVFLVALLFPTYFVAQTGGMNVGSINASNSVEVGSPPESVALMTNMVSLPPLTNSDIFDLGDVPAGSIVYSSESDVLLVYDGYWWKRTDGQNNHYLAPPHCTDEFQDIDANIFYGIEIGDQCWMDRNLAVTHYPNGDPIPSVPDAIGWQALLPNNTDDAYCYYDNNSALGYGPLYTYAAAIADNWTRDNETVINGDGAQGICPDGWHLPTNDEWYVLENYLIANGYNYGGSTTGNIIGKSLATTSGWNNSTTAGHVGNDQPSNNSSGFNGLSSGYRFFSDGTFLHAAHRGYWWASTESSTNYSWTRFLTHDSGSLHHTPNIKAQGYSVRCIWDTD